VFPALKCNLGSHNFKDNHELETVVTPWPITQQKSLSHDVIRASVVM
jgi:hypothetical protein